MIRYSFRSIKKNKKASSLFILALSTIFIAVPLSLSTIQQMNASIEQNIEEHARGTFDLLIRPEGSQTNVEQQLNLVEENYLSFNKGGIPLAEWESIRNLETVEVAAPVASIGYFTGQNNSIEFAPSLSSMYVEGSMTTTDGVHDYLLAEDQNQFHEGMFLLEQDSFDLSSVQSSEIDGVEMEIEPEDVLDSLNGPFPGSRASYQIPAAYYSLFAIDRAEEEKLTGLDLSAFDNPLDESLTFPHTGEIMAGDNYAESVDRFIPIVHLDSGGAPLTFHLTVDTLNDWSSEDTIALKDRIGLPKDEPFYFAENEEVLEELFEELQQYRTDSETIEIDLSKYTLPFKQMQPVFNEKGEEDQQIGGYDNIDASGKYYTTKPVAYKVADERLEIEVVDNIEGIPTYRELEEHGEEVDMFQAERGEFLFIPVGSYSVDTHEDMLASSPLGIYMQSPVTTTDGTIVTETTKPGSFVASPAHGLITLDEAEYFKGEAPIDAIRVRIAGVEGYTEEARIDIEEAAVQIHELGAFQIDMIAGSSPHPMTMDVEGIGEVTQAWTGLGAAVSISEEWSMAQLIMTSLFILSSIGYIINRFIFRQRTREDEKQLLKDLGWTSSHLRRFYLLENLLLASISVLIAAGAIFILFQTQLVEGNAYVYLVVMLAVTVGLMFLQTIWMNRKRNKLSGLKGDRMWFRNLYYYKGLIGVAVLQLVFVTSVTLFVASSLSATMAATSITNLGVFINDHLFMSLIIMITAALILAVITVIETTSAFLIIRKEEWNTLRDIGWKRQDVYRLCMKESSVWTVTSILLGVLVSLLFIVNMYGFSSWMFLGALTGCAFLLIGVLASAHIIIHSHLRSYS